MKWLRWIVIALGALVAILAIAGFSLYGIGSGKLARKIDVDIYPIEIPADSASIQEGYRLARVFGCTDCHGANLEGEIMIDEAAMGRLVAPHLAPGGGSATADYTTEDWIRSVRHGVGKDGRPLVIMPSADYHGRISGSDMGMIIAGAMHAQPVDNELPQSELRLAKAIIGAGLFNLAYDEIDHAAAPRTRPEASNVVELGEYMGVMCRGCHGKELMGDEDMGGPQLARGGGVMDPWDEDDFRHFFATGATPDGRQIDPDNMPWATLGYMTGDEMHAVWTYLGTVMAPAQ